MAKKKIEYSYKISYPALTEKIKSEKISGNYLFFIYNHVILEEIIQLIGMKFIGKDYHPKEHLKKFYSDEININKILSESNNLGFFSEKKINLVKYFKKAGTRGIKKEDKESILKYIKSPNPDTLMIIAVTDDSVNPTIFSDFDIPEMRIHMLKEPTEQKLLQWIREKLSGYKIEQNALEYLLGYIELSYDSANEEINKLISYNADSKVITIDSVNKCIGFTKDYSEMDFLKAILSRNMEKAIQIYKNLYLKSDIELRLLGYLNNMFSNLSKLIDPSFDRNKNLINELRLYTDFDEQKHLYFNYVRNINELKIKKGFDYICRTDLMVKFSKYDRYTVFTTLIHNLINL
ncbi:MAG: DNA polymerase III subunit delta [Ignavibacteria bacterium]|nr:DNA polymerase III subunit delta [Ignavibacteria bacterium]